MEDRKVPAVCRSGYSFRLWHTPLEPLHVRSTSLRCRSSPVAYVCWAASTSGSESVYAGTWDTPPGMGRSGSKGMVPGSSGIPEEEPQARVRQPRAARRGGGGEGARGEGKKTESGEEVRALHAKKSWRGASAGKMPS